MERDDAGETTGLPADAPSGACGPLHLSPESAHAGSVRHVDLLAGPLCRGLLHRTSWRLTFRAGCACLGFPASS